MHWKELNKELGNIDIYWLDFILKGYLVEDAKILDVGCGEGRNLLYLMRNGYDVYGVDQEPIAIQYLRTLAKSLKINNIEARFQVQKADKLLFPDNTFDVILSSAVYHFSRSTQHFYAMLTEGVRVLKPGGVFLIRCMTDHFLSPEDRLKVKDNIIVYAENQERFLVNDELIESFDSHFPLQWLEPAKFVVVDNSRSMSTFLLQKKLS